jgi:hypothetical protein
MNTEIDRLITLTNRRLDAIAMELVFLPRPDGKDHLRGLWSKRADLELPEGVSEEDAHAEAEWLRRQAWNESRIDRAGVKA